MARAKTLARAPSPAVAPPQAEQAVSAAKERSRDRTAGSAAPERPPGNGEPSPVRSAAILGAGRGRPGERAPRARLASGLQRRVGNARTGRLLGGTAAGPAATEGGTATPTEAGAPPARGPAATDQPRVNGRHGPAAPLAERDTAPRSPAAARTAAVAGTPGDRQSGEPAPAPPTGAASEPAEAPAEATAAAPSETGRVAVPGAETRESEAGDPEASGRTPADARGEDRPADRRPLRTADEAADATRAEETRAEPEAEAGEKAEKTGDGAKAAEPREGDETAREAGAATAAQAKKGEEAREKEEKTTETEGPAEGEKAEAAGAAAGAAPAAAGPAGAAGGGAATAPEGAGGADAQGGGEEEGEAEIEEKLARADPERAAADQADPAAVATGAPVVDEAEEAASPEAGTGPPAPAVGAAEPAEPPAAEAASPEPGETAAAGEDEAAAAGREAPEPAAEAPSPDLVPGPGGGPAEAGAAGIAGTGEEPEPPGAGETTVDEVGAADGFSGDEPPLGAGAIVQSEAPDLSEAEKKVALQSIGESAGGGGGAAGGGGGGGGAIEEKPPPEVPDVSSEEPAAALAKVGHLPPAQLQQALGGVKGAVSKSAGDERKDLAANPPEMERPTGSPKNLHGKADGADTGDGKAAEKVKQVKEGEEKPTPEPEPLPTPPPSPAEKVREPAVSGTEGGELSERDVQRMSSSLGALPTRDPGLHATAGPAPAVELTGSADPARNADQRQELQATVAMTEAEGRRDVAREMGENTKIYPSVPSETLTAKFEGGGAPGGGAPGGGGAGAAGGAAAGGGDQEALSILAQEEKGGEIRAAVTKAQGDMTAKKEEYATKVSDEKARSAKEISELETKSAEDQSAARSEAQAEVAAKKTEWSQEQETAVSEANAEADAEVAKGRKDVARHKQEADRKAGEEIRKGDEEAERERLAAERKAAEEKRKGEREKESSGFFGWLASKAKSFFNAIKSAIKAAFDLARKAIKKAIELAKKAAMWAIEQARKAIVAAIKAVGAALIAIGDHLLAAFPALRDKFRKFIQDKVDTAVDKVNEYADQLKKDVAAALDALAAGLDKLIGWLEKGMLAVVDAVASAVDGAIKFAEKVAQAIGAFIALVKDVAAGPVQWISNLGAGVVDGIRNHLWKAFQAAVKEWFNSKLEQVLGLGETVWELVKSGGLSIAKIGQMAWDGLKAMIPTALVMILVEKLVSMIVPAAGAVKLIIEGLQAAWGAVSRIIAAFQAFFDFLKAVKGGGAGPKFATALAAAAIAVIDFIANWLIAKLAKGAQKIGGKIKGLAKKIMGRKKGRAMGRKAKAKAASKPKAKTPKKTPKKKPTKPKTAAKPKKGAKDTKRDRKKDQDKKSARQRLRKAKAAIRARLRSGVPEKKATGVINRIAAKYRVRAGVSPGAKRWTVVLTANPTMRQFFEDDDARAAVQGHLKSARRTQKSLVKLLSERYQQELKRLRAEAKKMKAEDRPSGADRREKAMEKVHGDIKEAGGPERFIDENAANLDPVKAPHQEGDVFEATVRAAIKAKAEAAGKVFIGSVRNERGGFDVTVADTATGTLETWEIKRGSLRALSQKSSKRGVADESTLTELDPGKKPEHEGSEAARHIAKDPEKRAAEITEEGKLPSKERKDGTRVVFENKVSAITTNLMSNLAKVESDLVSAIGSARGRRRRKLKTALRLVKRIRSMTGGKLRRVIGTGKKSPETEIDAVIALLDSSAAKLRQAGVPVEDVIGEINSSGDIVSA